MSAVGRGSADPERRPLPFKHNSARRHRIPRAQYRVRNWPQYDAGLRRRGDLTLWLDEAVMAGWQVLGLELGVPDHTTLSRRSSGLAGRRPRVMPHEPLHLLIDSTGLKLFGQSEWQEEKHGRARRSWRKLHLAFDADTGEIAASILTDNHADDAGQVPDLFGQIEGEIASVTADGAYDGEPVYQAVERRQPGQPPTVIIPPRA